MLTPSGRFKVNMKLCLSMSDYHPETWNPMWSVGTILVGLFSFMLSNKRTVGSMECAAAKREHFAKNSMKFNLSQKIFRSTFPEFINKIPVESINAIVSDSAEINKDRKDIKENSVSTKAKSILPLILFVFFIALPVLLNVFYFT